MRLLSACWDLVQVGLLCGNLVGAVLLAAASVTTQQPAPPLALELVASGLPRPVQVVAPPGDLDRLFVVQQTGQIRVVRDGQLLPTPFLDLSGGSQLSFGGERGLLGLAFHPDYAQNRQFFVFRSGKPFVRVVVERYEVSAANPDVADFSTQYGLLEIPMPFGNHQGGAIAFGPDGYLYVGVGDGGSTPPAWPFDPFNHAQRGDSLIGKILRLDVDQVQAPLPYGIPPSNPFVSDPNTENEIWARGVRNPWRCTFDRLTGDFYVADVGGRNEELDFEPSGSPGGRNYGWSCMSGTFCTGLTVCTCNGAVLTPPIHEYDLPAPQAIIGGYVYRGCAMPLLRGRYLFADFMSGQSWSLLHDGQGVALLTERTAELLAPPPFSLSQPCGFGEDARGELYVCNLTGEVYRIVPASPQLAGLQPFGNGTPGCLGPHALGAACSPVLGNPDFGLICSNAPASSLGLLAFANAPDIAGSDVLGIGMIVHVQVGAGFFVAEPMPSDAGGVGRYELAIPGDPALAGLHLHAQAVWGWPAGPCQPSALGWSSSAGLSFVLLL